MARNNRRKRSTEHFSGRSPKVCHATDSGLTSKPSSSNDSGLSPKPSLTTDSGLSPNPSSSTDSGLSPKPSSSSNSGSQDSAMPFFDNKELDTFLGQLFNRFTVDLDENWTKLRGREMASRKKLKAKRFIAGQSNRDFILPLQAKVLNALKTSNDVVEPKCVKHSEHSLQGKESVKKAKELKKVEHANNPEQVELSHDQVTSRKTKNVENLNKGKLADCSPKKVEVTSKIDHGGDAGMVTKSSKDSSRTKSENLKSPEKVKNVERQEPSKKAEDRIQSLLLDDPTQFDVVAMSNRLRAVSSKNQLELQVLFNNIVLANETVSQMIVYKEEQGLSLIREMGLVDVHDQLTADEVTPARFIECFPLEVIRIIIFFASKDATIQIPWPLFHSLLAYSVPDGNLPCLITIVWNVLKWQQVKLNRTNIRLAWKSIVHRYSTKLVDNGLRKVFWSGLTNHGGHNPLFTWMAVHDFSAAIMNAHVERGDLVVDGIDMVDRLLKSKLSIKRVNRKNKSKESKGSNSPASPANSFAELQDSVDSPKVDESSGKK